MSQYTISKIKHILGFLLLQPFLIDAQVWYTKKNIPEDFTFPVVVALNGNIHIMGGGTASGATNLHIRYTISTDTWDTLAPVPYKAQQPAGAVVNGRIHFCGGGFPNTGTRLALHYIYHSDLDTWFKASDLPVATAIHKALGLNGKFYILAGQPDKAMFRVFDPSKNQWSDLNALPDQNFWYGGICSGFGQVFRFGGGGSGAPSKLAHQYDTVNDQWLVLPDFPELMHAGAATVISDSQVYICGGYGSGIVSKNAYIYNTVSKNYRKTNPISEPRYYHELVHDNNCVFIVGGYSESNPDMGFLLQMNCQADNNLSHEGYLLPENIRICQKEREYQLHINSPFSKTYIEVELYNINGQVIFSDELTDGELKFELPAAGLYTLVIVMNDQIFTRKIWQSQ